MGYLFDLEYTYGLYGAIGYGGFFVDDLYDLDMSLVGSRLNASTAVCGTFSKNKGCLNVKGHVGLELPDGVFGGVGLDGLIGEGMGVIFPHAYHCSDPLCPVCCFDFARRGVRRAMGKFRVMDDVLEGFSKWHVIVSVPKCDYGLDFGVLRKKVSTVLEAVGVEGGWLVYHPKRYSKKYRIWFFAPHFHCVGYLFGGWVDGLAVRDIHNLSGYVVKKKPNERKNPVKTLMYQLSHAGVPNGHLHVVSWFGCLASRALRVSGVADVVRENDRRERLERNCCPVCGEKLVCVCRVAKAPVGFDYLRYEEKFVLDLGDNWVKVDLPRRWKKEKVLEDDGYYDFVKGFGGDVNG